MYCPECGCMNGHHPMCPNNFEEDWAVDTCVECDREIMQSECYYDTEDGAVCIDCAKEYYKTKMERAMARDYVEGGC